MMLSRWLPLLLLVISCASPRTSTSTTPSAPASASASASASAPAPRVDPLVDQLNLSFERGDSRPELWELNGQGYSLTSQSSAARSGRRGLHIRAPLDPAPNSFGVAGASLPVDKARGKRVRLSGWIRTRKVVGFAGLWLRADAPGGQVLGLENMRQTGPHGTTDWTRYEIALDVPVESSQVVFGALLVGMGEAWIDDLSFAFETPMPVDVEGLVLGPDGKPVARAVVAAVRGNESSPTLIVESGSDGRFTMTLPSADWAFTATGDVGAAAYHPTRSLSGRQSVKLRLGTGGFTVNGEVRVRGGESLPADARIVLTRYSELTGDLFVVPLRRDGTFKVRLPAANGYGASVLSKAALPERTNFWQSRDQYVLVDVSVVSPPPDSVVDWIRQAGLRLASVEAGHGFDDLTPLAGMLRDVRMVALGEATHGTREFFQMKHRMLEYLVDKHGFSVFAIEANLTEARRVNDYVLHGTGNAADALAGLYFWTWNTEEVLALIEWMRAYNLNPRHKQKVQFLGFDMQFTHVAWPNVVQYLQKVDPEYARALPLGLSVFADKDVRLAWQKLAADERQERRDALDALVARLDADRKKYTSKSSASEWRWAREDARLVAQAAKMFDPGANGSSSRDEAMAENVAWILAQEAKGTKVVLWAHNAHIAPLTWSMGKHLRGAYGDSYLTFGFAFAEGSFQAIDMSGKKGLREVTLGPAPETDMSTAFTRAGCSVCLLDLRKAPKGEVADWFAAPHPMRETGAVFTDEASMTLAARLADLYDAVVFVRNTTRARPNPPRP